MKKRILITATSIEELGGVSIQAKHLLDTFSLDENVEMSFVPSNPRLTKSLSWLQKIKGLRTIFTSLKFWALLISKVRKNDIVHVFSVAMTGYIFATLPPLFIAKLCRKQTILHYHSGELDDHIKQWRRLALPTMRMFDSIVVPSQFLVDVFAKYGLKAEVVPNFIHTEKFKFRERKKLRPIFLSNRNFEFYYDVSCLIRAFGEIQKEFAQAELIVAGYGSEKEIIENLVVELDLKHIDFVGKVSMEEMPSLYEKADIYLNSSIIDNLPLSIIQAFSCGLPVVSTNPGGIQYMVKHGETGLLVETNDHVSLALEAIKLLNDDQLAQRIIRNANLEISKYELANVYRKWRQFYASLDSDRIP